MAIPPPPFHPVRSLSRHHPIPVFAAQNAKTRKSGSRFAGFVSGPICPVDFIFMSQPKEQIKNFFKEAGKSSRSMLCVTEKVYLSISYAALNAAFLFS
ncbi:hypothetical protein [Thalassospira xiamenensis]|uniref:hypothetical protein n=1 Tax=Thalassospira xiamenensis TaxID=220697 RepID=UPI000DEDE439|nr:hypothetical protein [Thalassospira xiamenensis]